jgi:hypothetical protein
VSERAPDFYWDGRAVYRCGKCPYERVENLAAILEHEADVHGIVVRETTIIGLDDKPLLVEEQPPLAAAEGTKARRRRT